MLERKLYTYSKLLAVLLMISAVAWPIGALTNQTFPAGTHLFYGVLQIGAGAFLYYASHLKLKQEPLSHKLYPASIATSLLALLMWLHWIRTTL